MTKTILITGATDGIGLLTAQRLAKQGHRIGIHGRSLAKLGAAVSKIGGATIPFRADLSDLGEVNALVKQVSSRFDRLDVLINNAGVFKTANPITTDGFDVRFIVNTVAPYFLTKGLVPLLPESGRVINLSSAAQKPVDLDAMQGQKRLDDMSAYAQSKLAITAWTYDMAQRNSFGPVFIAVNPGSLLASKMVQEGFGVAGNDLSIGADILCRAALDVEFADASGKYFDNDAGEFASIFPQATQPDFLNDLRERIESFSP